jgi:hypothetical protein
MTMHQGSGRLQPVGQACHPRGIGLADLVRAPVPVRNDVRGMTGLGPRWGWVEAVKLAAGIDALHLDLVTANLTSDWCQPGTTENGHLCLPLRTWRQRRRQPKRL